jgi:death-on-curing protein
MEPCWLNRQIVDLIHNGQLLDHGGNVGVLNEGSIESAIARARNRFAYEQASLFDCAAAYVFGLAKNHGYRDANKRTAYMAGITFLYVNGWHVTAPDEEKILLMVGVAEGARSEPDIAAWLREHATART